MLAGPASLAPAAINLLDVRVEYSADSVIGSGPNPRTGHLWRTPAALRHDMDGQDIIVRFDSRTAWLLIPQLKLALQTDLAGLSQLTGLPDLIQKLNPVAVGSETIEGVRATKYKVAANDPKDGEFSGFVWRTPQGIVVKIDGEGEHQGHRGAIHLLFHNIRIARQDASLFEPAPEFKRLAVSARQIDLMLKGLEQMGQLRGGGTAPGR